MRDIEKEIIDFIDQKYNTKKYFLCGPKRTITLDTSIRMILNSFLKIVKNFYKSTSSVGI